MKKVFFVSIAFVLALVCLVACGKTDPKPTELQLQKLTDALSADYSAVDVNIKTTVDGTELEGVFNVTFGEQTALHYSYQKLNELDINGSNDGFVSVVEGDAVISDDVVTDGENSLNLSEVAIGFTGFSFKTAFFASAQQSDNQFDADVTNPQGFLGKGDFAATNMHVHAVLANGAFVKLTLSYTASGTDVEVTYIFYAASADPAQTPAA